MTHLLKPLLQRAPQPLLTTVMPNSSPPPSQLTAGASLTVPPPTTPCSLRRPEPHSLLDSGDTEGVDLPGCLLPTHNSPKKPNSSTPPLPQTKRTGCTLPSTEDRHFEGSPVMRSHVVSTSNGVFMSSLRDQQPLASHPPSPSLSFSMSLSSSPSLSPCQGPHPSRPGSCASRGLLLPPLCQDTPPMCSSHYSAPPSLTSSPGDQRLRPSPSIPPVSPPIALHPSILSLPLSLDLVSAERRQAETQTTTWCNSQLHCGPARPAMPPQELEMQEWRVEEQEGKSSTEHISFIDEDEPAV